MANVYMGTDVEDFIFGEGTVYENKTEPEVETPAEDEVEEAVTDEELNMLGVIECVDDPEVACYRIALENEQNYNAIMNAVMMKEFSVLESEGAEMVYEAADVKKFFELVKKTIASWWSKIQGVIKKVIDKVSELTDVNKQFVKKYKDADIKTPEKEKEFVGYNFTGVQPKYVAIADLVAKAANVRMVTKIENDDAANELISKFKEDFETTKSHMRGAACGKASDKVSAEDYDKELKVALFGSENKVKVELKAFSELLTELESAKAVKAEAKAAYKEAQDTVKALLKEVKVAEAELKKAEGRKNSGMKVGKCLTDAINSSLTIMSKAFSVHTNAMLSKVRQDRAMAAFYVMNQPKAKKEEAKTESAVEADGLDVVII